MTRHLLPGPFGKINPREEYPKGRGAGGLEGEPPGPMVTSSKKDFGGIGTRKPKPLMEDCTFGLSLA